MEYILIDNFNGNINIVTKEDGSGDPLVLNSLLEAKEALSENCQDGQIIPLGINLISLFSDCEEVISTVAFEEETQEEYAELTERLDAVLDLKDE